MYISFSKSSLTREPDSFNNQWWDNDFYRGEPDRIVDEWFEEERARPLEKESIKETRHEARAKRVRTYRA